MNIKEIRFKVNLTQKEFADKICLKAQTVQKYESGERNIPESIKKLIRYEFAEHLPPEEALFSKAENAVATGANARVKELEKENHELLLKIQRLEKREKELERDKNILQGVVESLTAGSSKQQVG